MSKTFELTSADDRVVEYKTWNSPDYSFSLKTKNECIGGVATFTEAPEIPQDYSEDEGLDVVMLDGFDMFEYSSGQLSDEIEFIDAPPEEEQQAIIDAWADSLNSGLEDLEWVEGDAEVIFYGSLLVDGKPTS